MSGNEMMDIPNEEKTMCMVAGGQGGDVKMMMIFQEYSFPSNSNSSQTNGNIVIFIGLQQKYINRYVGTG